MWKTLSVVRPLNACAVPLFTDEKIEALRERFGPDVAELELEARTSTLNLGHLLTLPAQTCLLGKASRCSLSILSPFFHCMCRQSAMIELISCFFVCYRLLL